MHPTRRSPPLCQTRTFSPSQVAPSTEYLATAAASYALRVSGFHHASLVAAGGYPYDAGYRRVYSVPTGPRLTDGRRLEEERRSSPTLAARGQRDTRGVYSRQPSTWREGARGGGGNLHAHPSDEQYGPSSEGDGLRGGGDRAGLHWHTSDELYEPSSDGWRFGGGGGLHSLPSGEHYEPSVGVFHGYRQLGPGPLEMHTLSARDGYSSVNDHQRHSSCRVPDGVWSRRSRGQASSGADTGETGSLAVERRRAVQHSNLASRSAAPLARQVPLTHLPRSARGLLEGKPWR